MWWAAVVTDGPVLRFVSSSHLNTDALPQAVVPPLVDLSATNPALLDGVEALLRLLMSHRPQDTLLTTLVRLRSCLRQIVCYVHMHPRCVAVLDGTSSWVLSPGGNLACMRLHHKRFF